MCHELVDRKFESGWATPKDNSIRLLERRELFCSGAKIEGTVYRKIIPSKAASYVIISLPMLVYPMTL